ncbi:hypothetical protein [Pedobacter sp.]
MDTLITNTYLICQKSIKVNFRLNLVSIDLTAYTSNKDIKEIFKNCSHLVNLVKTDYQKNYQQALAINNASFVAEIWGHLVAYRIALWTKRNVKFSFIERMANFVAFRSGIIDCGEANTDTNRWFWNIIGGLFFRKNS